jgi:hypothetical protein
MTGSSSSSEERIREQVTILLFDLEAFNGNKVPKLDDASLLLLLLPGQKAHLLKRVRY